MDPLPYAIVDGDLVVQDGASLPDVCLKCGAPGGEKPMTRWRRVVGPATIDIALCNACAKRWRAAELNRFVMTLAMSLAGVVWCVGVLFFAKMPPASAFVGVAVAAAIYPLVYYRFWLTFRAMMVWPVATSAGRVRLAGVHPSARERLARM